MGNINLYKSTNGQAPWSLVKENIQSPVTITESTGGSLYYAVRDEGDGGNIEPSNYKIISKPVYVFDNTETLTFSFDESDMVNNNLKISVTGKLTITGYSIELQWRKNNTGTWNNVDKLEYSSSTKKVIFTLNNNNNNLKLKQNDKLNFRARYVNTTNTNYTSNWVDYGQYYYPFTAIYAIGENIDFSLNKLSPYNRMDINITFSEPLPTNLTVKPRFATTIINKSFTINKGNTQYMMHLVTSDLSPVNDYLANQIVLTNDFAMGIEYSAVYFGTTLSISGQPNTISDVITYYGTSLGVSFHINTVGKYATDVLFSTTAGQDSGALTMLGIVFSGIYINLDNECQNKHTINIGNKTIRYIADSTQSEICDNAMNPSVIVYNNSSSFIPSDTLLKLNGVNNIMFGMLNINLGIQANGLRFFAYWNGGGLLDKDVVASMTKEEQNIQDLGLGTVYKNVFPYINDSMYSTYPPTDITNNPGVLFGVTTGLGIGYITLRDFIMYVDFVSKRGSLWNTFQSNGSDGTYKNIINFSVISLPSQRISVSFTPHDLGSALKVELPLGVNGSVNGDSFRYIFNAAQSGYTNIRLTFNSYAGQGANPSDALEAVNLGNVRMLVTFF